MSDKIRGLLQAAATDNDVLCRLRDDPAGLADDFGLTPEDIGHLERGGVLAAIAHNPLLEADQGWDMTTTSPITITATPQQTTSPITITATPQQTTSPITITATPQQTTSPITITATPQQTTSPITITVTTQKETRGTPLIAAVTSPRSLEELSHQQLLQVARRVLADRAYASRVQAFLTKR
ncbi:hypothetical protein ACGFX2_37980 [Streptomyces goshikiensis]|uniref:hypothetical protein n=1 Tax=Streptomyces goshikiensis TaxID=1942 RepID=UPI0037180F49